MLLPQRRSAPDTKEIHHHRKPNALRSISPLSRPVGGMTGESWVDNYEAILQARKRTQKRIIAASHVSQWQVGGLSGSIYTGYLEEPLICSSFPAAISTRDVTINLPGILRSIGRLVILRVGRVFHCIDKRDVSTALGALIPYSLDRARGSPGILQACKGRAWGSSSIGKLSVDMQLCVISSCCCKSWRTQGSGFFRLSGGGDAGNAAKSFC